LSADAPPTNASTKDEVSAWSPFRFAAYAVLWTATVVSNIGTWMYNPVG